MIPHPPSPPQWLTQDQFHAFATAGTNAHRIASGPGGWIERLADDLILSFKDEPARDQLLTDLATWTAATGWSPARVFTRYLPVKNADRISPQLHAGDASLPLTTEVTETHVRYALDIAAGYSHGLFLDQRSNRAKLRALQPRRVLNTFAYTCSFSVVAALAGAHTTSVDLSRRSLDRGKQNFTLNGLDPTTHRFIADDALDLLPTLYSRGERFDAIILDPPTFSRGNNGRRWQIEQDLEDLLNAALDLAAPRCAVLLSTNCNKIDAATLERRARQWAKLQRRTADYVRPTPNPDFPTGHGATTLWMHLR